MQQDQPEKNKEKMFRAIMVVVLAAIIVISVTFVIINNNQDEDEDVVATYVDKSKEEVFSLLNKSKEYDEVNEEFVYNISKIHLTIYDCRSLDGWCTCRFNTEGHLPGATLLPARSNYTSLYYNVTNDKNDILIYTTDGKNGERFCENLTGNVYGKLYNLVGGFNSWKAAGYPIEPVLLS